MDRRILIRIIIQGIIDENCSIISTETDGDRDCLFELMQRSTRQGMLRAWISEHDEREKGRRTVSNKGGGRNWLKFFEGEPRGRSESTRTPGCWLFNPRSRRANYQRSPARKEVRIAAQNARVSERAKNKKRRETKCEAGHRDGKDERERKEKRQTFILSPLPPRSTLYPLTSPSSSLPASPGRDF